MKIQRENFFGILISTRLVKEVNHIRCFAIDIAKDLILNSCRLAMEHVCVCCNWRQHLQRLSPHGFRSPERYNGWFREQLGQRFTFFNFFQMMTDNA